MSIKRLRARESQQLIAEAADASKVDARRARLMSEMKVDGEDRRFLQGLGCLERWWFRRRRDRLSIFFKRIVITSHERGVLTADQARLLIRSMDNRLYPEGK